MNPRLQRDLPIGILVSLFVCAGLYVAVCLVITGMVPYVNLGGDAPLANAFREKGLNFVSVLISVGAVCGLTTTVLVGLYVQVWILIMYYFLVFLIFQLPLFFAINLFKCDDTFYHVCDLTNQLATKTPS